MAIGKDSKIIIAGSGVFGLSSALHLVKSGYTNITIFDRLDMYALGYTFTKGADTASADINKFFRAYYSGDEFHHQLANKARVEFMKWHNEVAACTPAEAKAKFNIEGKLVILEPCGTLKLDKTVGLAPDMVADLKDFVNSGLRDQIYDICNPEDVARAKKDGFGAKVDDMFGINAGKNPHIKKVSGLFDSTSGLLSAHNCCLYVNAYLRNNGVKFITGDAGTVKELIQESDGTVRGFRTADAFTHLAALSIVAAGPWSASLVPELAGLSEAQNGNVLMIKIPDNRPDLKEKYSPKNFPLISWKLGKNNEREKFGGFAAFPYTDGYVKFIVRQRKYNNPTVLENGAVTSVPVTAQSYPRETRISKYIVSQVKQFIRVFFPDLVEFGIDSTRLLWYTDTINNDFIIDYVPGKKNLIVVTGGSGHGFKFLPVLGKYTVDLIEGRKSEGSRRYQWRDPKDFPDQNTIASVKTGENAYYAQELATPEDLKFSKEDLEGLVDLNYSEVAPRPARAHRL